MEMRIWTKLLARRTLTACSRGGYFRGCRVFLRQQASGDEMAKRPLKPHTIYLRSNFASSSLLKPNRFFKSSSLILGIPPGGIGTSRKAIRRIQQGRADSSPEREGKGDIATRPRLPPLASGARRSFDADHRWSGVPALALWEGSGDRS